MLSSALIAALAALLASPSFAGQAFDELKANAARSGYAAPQAPKTVPAPPLSAEEDADITVQGTPKPPEGIGSLPDDAVREEPPTAREVVPQFSPLQDDEAPLNLDSKNIIPFDLKAAAVEYFRAHRAKFGHSKHLGIIDFSKHSSQARFYIADTESGEVKVLHVAHGSGSDSDRDGYANLFSNRPSSNASSLGFYLTGDLYSGKHGRSMRLHGLSATNSNAYARALVIHAAGYVKDEAITPGRSWGCPAVSAANLDFVLGAFKDGALIYAGLSKAGP